MQCFLFSFFVDGNARMLRRKDCHSSWKKYVVGQEKNIIFQLVNWLQSILREKSEFKKRNSHGKITPHQNRTHRCITDQSSQIYSNISIGCVDNYADNRKKWVNVLDFLFKLIAVAYYYVARVIYQYASYFTSLFSHSNFSTCLLFVIILSYSSQDMIVISFFILPGTLEPW